VSANVEKLPDWAMSARAFVAASHRRPRKRSVKDESGITYREARLENARPFEWAWNERILLGYFNLLVGVEGIGKGTLVAWLLAQITRGQLPGDLQGEPRYVAIAGDEDSFENNWVPRLHVAGADLKLVRYIERGATETLDVRADADAIKEYIRRHEFAVVYLDQLLDNLGYANSWKEQDVRNALAPLRRVAQDTNCSFLATMHPNKRQGSFRDRVSGSPAFNAVSRSSLCVVSHPDEPGRVLVVRAKGNYSKEPPAFEFRIEDCPVDVGKHVIPTSRITNIRESALRAHEVLDRPARARREETKAGLARRLLSELFADGEVRPAAVVQALIHEQHELAPRIVTQAATDLGFEKWQQGYPGTWFWRYGKGVANDG
jgi:AAA domain